MKQLSTADGKITGVQSGEGPDLVILHSLLTDRTAFDAVVPALLEQYRVTLFNLPGFHGSAPIAASLPAYVAWIAKAFDGFGVKPGANLLGNGFGGTLALAFALDHPDRLQRLVICDAAAGFPEQGKQAFRMMAQKVGEGGMGAIAEVAANRVFHAEYLAKNPGVTEERRSILLAVDPAAFKAACTLLIDADLAPRLAELKVPTQVICGALDQATPPPLNRVIAEGVAGARYTEIPACGHCPPLENPEAFLRAFEGQKGERRQMRDFDERNLTEAVIQRFDNCDNPRLQKVLTSLVRHLHDFVRDIEPSEAEWAAGIDFLTRTGQMCDERRQEFILLSDTLGVSMLVDAINHRSGEGATETTVQGPFYVADAPTFPLGADIRGGAEGKPLFIEGMVRSASGQPLAGATVDVWQSDDAGHYDVQQPELGEFHLRGRFTTDDKGRFWLWSILPKFYPIPTDGPVGAMLDAAGRHPFRPAHVHFMIQAPGHERLVTHVFVDDDPYLDSDAVFGVKQSLIRDLILRQGGIEPDGKPIEREHSYLSYDFGLRPAKEKERAAA